MANPFLQAIGKETVEKNVTTGNPFLSALSKPSPVKPIETPKTGVTGVMDVIKGIPSAAKELYGSLFSRIFPTYAEPTKHLIDRGGEYINTAQQGTPAEKVAASVNVITAGLGVLFTPITAIFSEAEKIPELKPAVDIITAPFVVTGMTGEFIADRFIDALPTKIPYTDITLVSEEAKDILRPAFKEAGGLAGMIWLGGKAMDVVLKGEPITKPKIKELVEEAKVVNETTLETPIEAPKQPIEAVKTPETITTPKVEINPFIEAVRPKEVAEVPVPTEPIIPETKPSGIAKSVEAKAIEKGLIDKGYDELAGFDSSTMKAQAELASKYGIDQINRIATGKEPLPEGMKPATAFSIAEDFAMETRDGALIQELAKSPIASQISEAASIVSLSRMRTPDSATAKIKEITKLREASTEKKLKGKKPAQTKAEMKKGLENKIKEKKPSKYDWNNFVESIKC